MRSVVSIFILENGNVYDGEMEDGKMDGHGKMIFVRGDCDTYEGEWDNGKVQGNGIMLYRNRDVYDGEWYENMRHGNGKMTYTNGEVYDGVWYENNRDDVYNEDDDIMVPYDYDGHAYVEPLPRPPPRPPPPPRIQNVTYMDGTYVGYIVHGKREGKNGKMTYMNGDVYVGDWQNDKMQGVYGKMIYANGDVYEGGWQEDMRSGPRGRMLFANGDVYDGEWRNDNITQPNNLITSGRDSFKGSFPRFPFSKNSVSNLPSTVIDMENDEWNLRLSGMDGNQEDVPIVFLAGRELFVYTRKRLLNELSDNTSLVYESKPEGRGVKLDVEYFNLRKLFHTLTGDIVPVKFLKNILLSKRHNKKTAVRQRYNSVTDQIDSIAKSNMDFSTKKKNIKTLLKDNRLPPSIYQFVPLVKDKVIQKIDRLWSKACADGVPGSYVSGLHGQDMGTQWTVHKVVEVENHRRKTSKKIKSSKSARSASKSAKSPNSAKSATRSARSAP